MSHIEHKRGPVRPARCFVLTVSDTRDERTDTSGAAIAQLLEQAGHTVTSRRIVPDDPAEVQRCVRHELAEPDAEVIITTGGTGITSRDTTYEALAGLLKKRLDGFGELFRMLSYNDVGSAAMLTRACAGVATRASAKSTALATSGAASCKRRASAAALARSPIDPSASAARARSSGSFESSARSSS